MNIFATALTYTAPSSNYRGESEENRTIIQKVTQGRFEYAIISPEAMRNALRETLALYGLECNRTRLTTEDQLAVSFKEYPCPEKYADDFFFGYLLAMNANDRKKFEEVRGKGYPIKRDSVLRMNLAKALDPYRYDTVFTQSPLTVKTEGMPFQNATTSALLHRETTVTAFQYPFAINLNDCKMDDPEHGRKRCIVALLHVLVQFVADQGMATGSKARLSPAMISATIAPCAIARWASIGSPVTSPIAQTLRIEVAQVVVDAHERAAHRKIERLEPEAARAGAPADRDQHLVGGDRALLAVRRRRS